ncbi:MAG: helix-hairpin-helix domain-containing protein [Bacilli bacterium]
MLKTIIIGLIVTIVGLFALTAVENAKLTDGNSVNGYSTSLVDDENNVKVNISGEVNHPGDYYIMTTNTLGDLILQAGGITAKADEKAYNENLFISTHTSFYIPPISESGSSCSETTISKVNINQAEVSELKNIGFTESQANSLITYRTENGDFTAIEEIMNVKGIGEATFSKVKNKITLY